jgi:hypothetical protein
MSLASLFGRPGQELARLAYQRGLDHPLPDREEWFEAMRGSREALWLDGIYPVTLLEQLAGKRYATEMEALLAGDGRHRLAWLAESHLDMAARRSVEMKARQRTERLQQLARACVELCEGLGDMHELEPWIEKLQRDRLLAAAHGPFDVTLTTGATPFGPLRHALQSVGRELAASSEAQIPPRRGRPLSPARPLIEDLAFLWAEQLDGPPTVFVPEPDEAAQGRSPSPFVAFLFGFIGHLAAVHLCRHVGPQRSALARLAELGLDTLPNMALLKEVVRDVRKRGSGGG